MFVATARYQFARPELKGADKVLPEGLRGSGSQAYASRIWGMSGTEYIERADPWPLNPKGELLLSLKIEDKYALANAEKVAAIPGIGFAEWGPGDMGLSLGFLENHDPPYPPAMAAARKRVMTALKSNHVSFLETVRMNDIERLFAEGTNVTHGSNEALTNKGRQLTKRQMPY
jgi:4-hydroxy-2-oxoheptanedioate aldolase